jgi:threonine dehydratase
LGQLNFEHVLKYVNGIVTVSEEEIFAATGFLLRSTKLIPEPSGAVTLAAALFHAEELPKVERVVVILSGGNIEVELKDRLMAEVAAV